MRKNIYDNNIIMFSYEELNDICCSLKFENEFDILEKCLHNAFPIGIYPNTKEEKIGISSDNEIIDIAKRVLENTFYKKKKISLKSLKNAYLYSIMFNDEFTSIKGALRTCSNDTTVSDFIRIYGEDVYNYVEAHKNYSYEKNEDPVLLKDLDIYLYENEVSKKFKVRNEETYKLILKNNYRN